MRLMCKHRNQVLVRETTTGFTAHANMEEMKHKLEIMLTQHHYVCIWQCYRYNKIGHATRAVRFSWRCCGDQMCLIKGWTSLCVQCIFNENFASRLNIKRFPISSDVRVANMASTIINIRTIDNSCSANAVCAVNTVSLYRRDSHRMAWGVFIPRRWSI